jgi:hypothetical protein
MSELSKLGAQWVAEIIGGAKKQKSRLEASLAKLMPDGKYAAQHRVALDVLDKMLAAVAPAAPKVAGLTDVEIEAIFHKLDGRKIIQGENQLNWNAAVRLAFARAIESALAAKGE